MARGARLAGHPRARRLAQQARRERLRELGLADARRAMHEQRMGHARTFGEQALERLAMPRKGLHWKACAKATSMRSRTSFTAPAASITWKRRECSRARSR